MLQHSMTDALRPPHPSGTAHRSRLPPAPPSAARGGRLQPRAAWPSVSALLAALAAAPALALPTFEQVKAAHRPSDVTLLARDGTPIQTLRTDPAVRRLQWLALDDVSPALLRAVVLARWPKAPGPTPAADVRAARRR